MKRFQRITAITIALLAIFGIGLNMYLASSFKSGINLFRYYTLQSNAIIGVVFLLRGLVFHNKKAASRIEPFVSGAVLWITVTGVVFHFMLSDIYKPTGLHQVHNVILHYIVPTASFLYYMFLEYDIKKRVRIVMWWISYPTVYAIVSIFRGARTGFYPYWFLNPNKPYPQGIGSNSELILFVTVLACVFVLLGFAVSGVKHVLFRKLYLESMLVEYED